MQKRVLVLGAGRVGSAMIRDLAGDFEVTAADVSSDALTVLSDVPGLTVRAADLRDAPTLQRLMENVDLVVGAVPGPMGFQTLRQVLLAGRDVVDISFFEQDAFELDELARAQGVVSIVDCGVAPGCSNLLLGRHVAGMERVDSFWCAVGGLPRERAWPYEYKAPFSPVDVIAEYTRPARFRRDGRDVVMPALSDVEWIDVPGVGTLEAFNTDGLRTLLRTMTVPDMVEKTMRYPGHAERMRMLRESGFFGEEAVETRAGAIRPIDLTAHLLFEAWQFAPGEPDLTIMRVMIEGVEAGARVVHRYDLIDHYDAGSGTQSMARTTGYTATAAVRLLASGGYTVPGITPPELLGPVDGAVDFIFADLASHGVVFQHTVEPAD